MSSVGSSPPDRPGRRPRPPDRPHVTFGKWKEKPSIPAHRTRQPRPGILRKEPGRKVRSRTDQLGTTDESWVRASDNAFELEWLSARSALRALAQRSMTAAETGVRLQEILRRFPSLMSDESGLESSSLFEGVGGNAQRSKRELLPLPLPQCRLVREAELASLHPSDQPPGPRARSRGLALSRHRFLERHGFMRQLRIFPRTTD